MAVRKSSKKASSTRKSASSGRNMVPVFVLVIMALSAALITVLNLRNADKPVKSNPSASAGDVLAQGGNAADIKASASVQPSSTAAASPGVTASASAGPAEKKVKAFFLMYNERSGKIVPAPVARVIKSADELSSALKETIKGPSSSEEKRGYISALPKNMKVRKAVLKDDIADIDLSKEFAEGIQGDAVAARVNQIFFTAAQFPGVKGIIIRINGKTVRTLGPDGLVMSWPMKRAL
jgi:spore germination protein GerM